MVGKITKLAAGVMMTHFRRTKVDTGLLAEVAVEAGALRPRWSRPPPTPTPPATSTRCAWSTTPSSPCALLCRRAAANCRAHADGALEVDVVCVDFDGTREVARG